MESIPKKGYFAKELALRTLFGDTAFNDLNKLLNPCCGIGVDKICIEPCGGDGSPSLPFNSIQYNNNGAFFGDALALRDPITNETIIKRVPDFGTDEGFESNNNLSFISTFLSNAISGSQLYWRDLASGNGASLVASTLPPGTTNPTITGLIGNTNSGDAAVFGVGVDPLTNEWSFHASGNNNVSNTAAQINASADDTSCRAEIEAENITTGELSKIDLKPIEALIEYRDGTGNFNTLRVNTSGHQVKVDTGTFNIAGIMGIPSYADDAAAIVGGLVSGDLYKTTTLGSTFLKIVP